MEISKEEYIKLLKLRNYVYNWYPNYRECPKCGRYNPDGCICINCGYTF